MQPDDAENSFGTNLSIPIFILDSAVVGKSGKTIEIERSCYRGDKYTFAILAHPNVNDTN